MGITEPALRAEIAAMEAALAGLRGQTTTPPPELAPPPTSGRPPASGISQSSTTGGPASGVSGSGASSTAGEGTARPARLDPQGLVQLQAEIGSLNDFIKMMGGEAAMRDGPLGDFLLRRDAMQAQIQALQGQSPPAQVQPGVGTSPASGTSGPSSMGTGLSPGSTGMQIPGGFMAASNLLPLLGVAGMGWLDIGNLQAGGGAIADGGDGILARGSGGGVVAGPADLSLDGLLPERFFGGASATGIEDDSPVLYFVSANGAAVGEGGTAGGDLTPDEIDRLLRDEPSPPTLQFETAVPALSEEGMEMRTLSAPLDMQLFLLGDVATMPSPGDLVPHIFPRRPLWPPQRPMPPPEPSENLVVSGSGNPPMGSGATGGATGSGAGAGSTAGASGMAGALPTSVAASGGATSGVSIPGNLPVSISGTGGSGAGAGGAISGSGGLPSGGSAGSSGFAGSSPMIGGISSGTVSNFASSSGGAAGSSTPVGPTITAISTSGISVVGSSGSSVADAAPMVTGPPAGPTGPGGVGTSLTASAGSSSTFPYVSSPSFSSGSDDDSSPIPITVYCIPIEEGSSSTAAT